MKILQAILIFVILSVFVPDSLKCRASKKYNRYLAHLFNKYGTGGTMTFEGLEHLMYNLRLGGLEFSPKHSIEEHHPNGYKIPELILEEDDDNVDDYEDHQHVQQKNGEHGAEEFIKEIDRGRMTRVHVITADLNDTKRLDAMKYNETETDVGQDLNETTDEFIDSEIQNDLTKITGSNGPMFKEMHDPKHRHPRHRDEHNGLAANRCLSPLALMKLVVDPDDIRAEDGEQSSTARRHRIKRHTVKTAVSDDDGIDNEDDITFTHTKITPTTFMKICPALLVQIDQDACAQSLVTDDRPSSKEDYYIAWIYATVSIFIISCCGLFGILVVPLARSTAYHEILKFLVAVAVGTLCGDALMHLLPHAMGHSHGSGGSSGPQEEDHNGPVWLFGCAFLTAIFMYSLETLLPLIKGDGNDGHGHGHSHQLQVVESKQSTINMETMPAEDGRKELNIMLDEAKLDEKENRPLSPVAFMVVLGDGLHNLTDGLAIGAAFAVEPVTGMATALAVLCHELPHELGDFALLIQTGVHINRAIYLNIVSSILSFIGMAIGLVVAELEAGMVQWIYAGTAGSFLYIALADLIPEMGRDGKRDLKNCLIQIFGIVLGGLIMLVIALHEDDLKKLFE